MIGTVIYAFLYILLHFLRKIGWFRWRIEGVEHLPPHDTGGMVMVMNHIHWIDIPAVGALLPFSYRLSWLAKIEIFEHPLASWFFRSMNVIPIKRGKRDVAALETSAEAVRQGARLLIFPEGHRSQTGVLQHGRGGAIRLAMRSNAPIVPIAIIGTEHGLKGTLSRKELLVQIGTPYVVEPTRDGRIPPDMMDHLTTDMMLRIATLLPEEFRGPYANRTLAPVDQQ